MAGGGSSQTTAMDMTPQAFKNLQQPFADRIASLMNGGGTGNDALSKLPKYDGPLTGTMTGNEQAILDQLMQQAGPGNPSTTAASDYFKSVVDGTYLPGQSGSNPFLTAAIESAQRPTLQGLEETLSRTLPGRFTQAGQFTQPQGSSAFDRAAAIATRGAADAMGDIATQMSFAGYESERGRQQEAAQGLATVSAQEVDTTIKNLQAQALPRLIEEYGIERGMQEFQNRTNMLMDLLKIVGAASSPVIASNSSSNQKPNLLPLL